MEIFQKVILTSEDFLMTKNYMEMKTRIKTVNLKCMKTNFQP